MKITSLNRAKPVLFFLIFLITPFLLVAQNGKIKISGKVLDEANQPLAGATVILKNSNQSVITDFDGKFDFLVSEQNTVFNVSFLGYKTQEVSTNGKTSLEIKLELESESLNTVVVIGYGSVGKKELTSAVTHINSSDLLQIGDRNAIMAIQGKVSGLSITNTSGSDPNSSPSIQLRGVSSRDAGSGPLIVIDGIPGGNLQNINPNDIASIDVLKDGAASAIYGTQGSAGVIVVTTKKGTSGALTTTYNGYTSIDIPVRQLKTLSTADFLKNNRGTDYGGNTDWLKGITRDYSLAQNHSVSVSGGTNNSNYRGTVDYRDANGLDLRSNRQEFGGRFALNHTSENNLYKISFSVAPRQIKYNNSSDNEFTQALTLNPTYPIMDAQNPSGYTNITGSGYYNPVEALKLEQSGGENKLLEWNGSFKVNFTKNFNSQITLAQRTEDYVGFFFRPSISNRAIQNGLKGEANRSYDNVDQRNMDWVTNYSLSYKQHSLKAMAGYSYQYIVSKGLSANNANFTSDALTYNNLGDGLYQQVEGRNGMGSYKEDSKLIGFFGRLTYSYANKYLATASIRHEGSSKFGPSNKWGDFPAVSVGWRISEESFLKDVTWVNDLKLRADYGITGNQNFGNYLSLSTYGGFGYYLFNGNYYQVWGPANNTNADLKWEKGKNMNIGLDFSLFNNNVSGSVNYYNRKQQDLLGWYDAPVPPNSQAATYANVGSMRNTGYELELNIKAVKTKDFSYEIGLVGATNDNKFLSFSNNIYNGKTYIDLNGLPAPGSPGTNQRVEEGKRIGNFYMWKFAGVDQFGNMVVYDKNGTVIQASKATEDDKRIVGNGLPKFTASFNHTFKYKNWDLGVYLRGAFGFDLFNIHEFYYGLQSGAANSNVLESAYTTNAAIKGDKVLSDYFLEKGDYLKLDVATIGYTIKSKSKYLNSFRVYTTGRNLATFTAFSGVDPEIYPRNGLTPGAKSSNSYYPSTAQFLLGAQISF